MISCVVHEIADRLDDAALEAALVGAARRGADAVDVGADRLVGRFGPLQGDLHLLAVALRASVNGSLGDRRLLAVGDEPLQELRECRRDGSGRGSRR